MSLLGRGIKLTIEFAHMCLINRVASFFMPFHVKEYPAVWLFLTQRNNINVCTMFLVCVGNHNKRCLKVLKYLQIDD